MSTQVIEGYTEVETIDLEDGLAVRVTKRRSGRGVDQYSFTLFRRYKKGNEDHETHWFSERHIDSLGLLLGRVRQVIGEDAKP